MRLARERGARVLAITNVMGSQATRDADGVLFTRAGLEIGVAATKTFLCQVAVMYLLGAAPRPSCAARSQPRASARAGGRAQAPAALHRRGARPDAAAQVARDRRRAAGRASSSSTSAATSACPWRSRAR